MNIQIPFEVLQAAVPLGEGSILYETDAEGAGGLFHLRVSLIRPLRLGAESGKLALHAEVRASVSPPRRGALSWLSVLGNATQWEIDYEVTLLVGLRVLKGWKLGAQISPRLRPRTVGKGLHIASANALAQPAAEKALEEAAQHLEQEIAALPLPEIVQAAWQELHQRWETESDPPLHLSLGPVPPPLLCARLEAGTGGLSAWLGITALPLMSDESIPLPLAPPLPSPSLGGPGGGESACPLRLRLSWGLLSGQLLSQAQESGLALQQVSWAYAAPGEALLSFAGAFLHRGQKLPGSGFKAEALVSLDDAAHQAKVGPVGKLRGGLLGRLLVVLGQGTLRRMAAGQSAEALEALRLQLAEGVRQQLGSVSLGEGYLLRVGLEDIGLEALCFYEGGLELRWMLRGQVSLLVRTLPRALLAQSEMPR
jgi:hypothetical protein